MAGTLLFIAKQKNSTDYNSKKRWLKLQIEEIFSQYFHKINYIETSENAFLVEFRKNENDGKFFNDHSGSWLTFEGVVFDLMETKSHSAESLFNLYQKYGSDFPNKIDGHYVIKLYDAHKNRYWVINDIIKNKTNYICETKDYIMFTPFAVTIGLIQEPEIDLYAMNEFLWRYYILSFRSMLKGVKRLEPASLYEYKNRQLSRSDFWDWPHHFTNRSFHDVVDETVASMQESARLIENTIGNPCIDFTMGQDTRQVISAFTNQKLNFTTSTFGKSDFYELQKVKEMATRHDIIHHNIKLTTTYLDHLFDYFKKAVILSSCEEPGHILSRILFMRESQKEFGNPLLNGQEGHFYKNGLWDEMYTLNFYREPKSFNTDLFLKIRALSKNYHEDIFTDEFISIKNDSKNYFKTIIMNSIKNHLKSPVSIQVDKFDCNHWLNFENVANSAANIIHNSISILYLRRNLELALQVPVQWKFNMSKYQRAVVHNLDPYLAAERSDFGGVTMTPKNVLTYIPFFIRYYYFQTDRFRNKLKTWLGLNVVTHIQEAWDYLPVYQKLYRETNLIDSLYYDKMNLSEILKSQSWKKLIENSYQDHWQRIDNYDFLLKIASIECLLNFAKKFRVSV